MPPPPGAADDRPAAQQPLDLAELDVAGLWGRDHPPPAALVGADIPASLRGQPLGGVLVVERADKLVGAAECRVGCRGDGLGEDGRHAQVRQSVLERLEEPVADHALGLGAEDVERERVAERRVLRALGRQHCDLGTVCRG